MPMYQVTSIVRAASTQAEVSELLSKLSKIVLDRNGVVAGINSWGLQQLAYRMRSHQEYHTHGRYVQFRVVASPTTLKELERNMKLDRRVLRHMTIKERNTSVASFANMDPAMLAERAIEISKQMQQARSEDGEGGHSWAETSREDQLFTSFGSEARPLQGSEVRSPYGSPMGAGRPPFGSAGRPTPSSMGGQRP